MMKIFAGIVAGLTVLFFMNVIMLVTIPTVGYRTIEQMTKVGATALAIEAGKTLLVERAQMIALADANGISIVAM